MADLINLATERTRRRRPGRPSLAEVMPDLTTRPGYVFLPGKEVVIVGGTQTERIRRLLVDSLG